MVDKVKEIPFLLEDRIVSLGGKYEKAAEPWGVSLRTLGKKTVSQLNMPQAHVVVSGNLITGQNPTSAKGVGEAILKALKA
jgi:putative intracellular protease/amidase